MKKIYYLLLLLLCTHASYAASCVSVRQVAVNYKTKQVTFDLKWTTCSGSHNYRTWAIVDYRTVNADGSKGAWTRATISAASAGTLVGTSNGVWVTGSANGTQRVTFTLSGVPARYDWCATSLDYPPNATLSNGVYTLHGTTPFVVTTSAGNTVSVNTSTYTANCITAVTDATGIPATDVAKPALNAGSVSGSRAININAATQTITQTAASGGFGAISYQWYVDGNAVNGATLTAYTPPTNVVTTTLNGSVYTRRATDACGTTVTAGDYTLCVAPSDALADCSTPVWHAANYYHSCQYCPTTDYFALCRSHGSEWYPPNTNTGYFRVPDPKCADYLSNYLALGCGTDASYDLRCVKNK